jgi:hypothetical protein
MADYAIEWYRIDAGGLTSSGGEFVVTGALHRAEPNVLTFHAHASVRLRRMPRDEVVVMAGDDFELEGSLSPGIAVDSMVDADGEVAAVSACGSGVDQALPLLMVFGIGAVSATAGRRRRLRP